MPRTSPGKLVVVIDDDPLVLEATGGLLESWGCRVVTAGSYKAARAGLARLQQRPDLIVCDYNLADGRTGIEAITRLRGGEKIPALLITGGPTPPAADGAVEGGYHLLHKPLQATQFRAALIGAAVLKR